MLKRKSNTAPSLNDRLANAQALRTAALASFESAVTDLEFAADEQNELAAEAQAEVSRLIALRDEARQAASDNKRAAEKIRALFA